jgi:hypothetical protein
VLASVHLNSAVNEKAHNAQDDDQEVKNIPAIEEQWFF